ncbi:MAG: hypothetical protein FWC40_01540 [Proteobacteria bacterium]|nr:hypothetical protein [Pseudomonadota bacterium]
MMESKAKAVSLDGVRVVLVEPQNPINVGNVMRAMKNMGVCRLSLVNPAEMDFERTQISAHRTQDMLETMQVVGSLGEALQGVHESYGFSARARTQTWSQLELEEASRRGLGVLFSGGEIALVFGREQTGLTNDELSYCTHRVYIQTGDYASLNLSQAVLLAVHGLFRQARPGASEAGAGEGLVAVSNHAPGSLPATQDRCRRLLGQTARMLAEIGYFKSDSPNAAMHRLQNIVFRAQLHEDEINLLMGICAEVSNYAKLIARGIEPSRQCPPRVFEEYTDS